MPVSWRCKTLLLLIRILFGGTYWRESGDSSCVYVVLVGLNVGLGNSSGYTWPSLAGAVKAGCLWCVDMAGCCRCTW